MGAEYSIEPPGQVWLLEPRVDREENERVQFVSFFFSLPLPHFLSFGRSVGVHVGRSIKSWIGMIIVVLTLLAS